MLSYKAGENNRIVVTECSARGREMAKKAQNSCANPRGA
jgi:hypothetical protein